MAWRHAADHGYKNIIICNNDLLVPDGTVQKLVEGLDAGWGWLLPVSSARGTNYLYPKHRLQDHYKLPVNKTDWTDNPLNYQRVQNVLNPLHGVRNIQSVSVLNGYMMAFRIPVMQQFAFSQTHMFDPSKINIGNEDALCRKIRNSTIWKNG